MQNIFSLAILPAITAFIFSLIFTPYVIKLAKKLNLIDDPRVHKHPKVIHTYPVPRGGGLAIFFAILLTVSIFVPFDKHLLGILGGAIVITVLGFFDDKYDLNPYFRLGIQFLAALIPIAAGIGIAFIADPFNKIIDLSQFRINLTFLGDAKSIWILADLFALFWMVFLMNIVNMGA